MTQDDKVLRLSFSRSLLEYLTSRIPGTTVRRVELKLGPEIPPGGRSASGLYAVCKSQSGWPLRATLFHELAERWRHPTRVVRECWLLPSKGSP